LNVLSRCGWAVAILLVAASVTACTRPNPAFTAIPVDAPADRPLADAAADPVDAPTLDAPPDAPPPLVVDCPAIPDLALCLRFENDSRDESPYATTVTATGVRYDPEVDGRAAYLTSASKIQVAESGVLAAQAITIEAWVKPEALPTDDDRVAIIDYSRQYALVVLAGGEVVCRVNTGGSSYIDLGRTGLLKVGTWSSVACTASGGTYSLWHNGVEMSSRSISGPLVSRGTTEPFLVGSNFPTSANPDTDNLLGHVDNVRIWRRLRTPQEICRGSYNCAAP
jgi:Concanavalin A-like lectin/glucanases superfamily